jgi:hypothetical protein
MIKLRTTLLTLAMLGTNIVAMAQVGAGWTLIPWAGDNEQPVQGRRTIHFDLNRNSPGLEILDWYNVDQIQYAFGRTGANIAGTYQYIKATETEIFRQYGPPTQSTNRNEIRVLENYGSGQIRQLEGYVTFNDFLSSDQAILQIWGFGGSNATLLQLRGKNGTIIGVGGLSPPELFTASGYSNKEFKLNVIHQQETRSGTTILQPGRVQVYIDGRLLINVADNDISKYTVNGVNGMDYFKYGCYGTVESSETNAQVIWKSARYFKDGSLPGTAVQTITFPDLPRGTVNGADLIPAATASSQLPVSYRSDNPAVATIVNGAIRPVGPGTANIWAYQDGDSTFAPARVVVKPLVVREAVPLRTQTINFPEIPAKTTNDASFAPGATTRSRLPITYTSNNPAVAVIAGDQVQIIGAGSANITAYQDGNSIYLPADPVTRTLVVTEAVQQ